MRLRSRDRWSETAASLDQRLGGPATVSSRTLPVPAGFSAVPVAAGLTAPCSIAAAPTGLLYVAEAGDPRRTPPRLLALDPETGVSTVLASFDWLAAPAALGVVWVESAPLVVAEGRCWRVPLDGDAPIEVSTMRRRQESAGGAVFAGLIPAATVWNGSLYLCDGSPRTPEEAGTPATGVLWRVATRTATDPTGRPGHAAGGAVRALAGRRSARTAVALACLAAVAIGFGLAVYRRERRARRWAAPAT